MILTKPAQFLTELFRLKVGGQNPTIFGDAVLPVVDVGGMYGADLQLTTSSTSAAGALQRTQTGTVGTTSRYYGAGAVAGVGAAPGTQGQLTIGYRSVGSTAFFPLFPTMVWTPFAGRSYWNGGLFDQPLIAPGGAQFEARFMGDAGGADHTVSLVLFLDDPLRA